MTLQNTYKHFMNKFPCKGDIYMPTYSKSFQLPIKMWYTGSSLGYPLIELAPLTSSNKIMKPFTWGAIE